MTECLLSIFIIYVFLFEISHAQYTPPGWPNAPPTTNPNIPKPAPTFERITPKCYPETAKVYFLPAPPSAPKITVLKPNSKDVSSNYNQNVRDKALSLLNEVPQSSPLPPPKTMSSRSFPPPPPPCSTGLPDLIDEVPTIIQDRFSRLAETEEKSPVCESCASLIKKLPIFNFDQELLDGFLAGLGI